MTRLLFPLAEIPNIQPLAAALPLRLLFHDRRPKGEDSQFPGAMLHTLFLIHIPRSVSVSAVAAGSWRSLRVTGAGAVLGS